MLAHVMKARRLRLHPARHIRGARSDAVAGEAPMSFDTSPAASGTMGRLMEEFFHLQPAVNQPLVQLVLDEAL
jgi:hypothetical protein